LNALFAGIESETGIFIEFIVCKGGMPNSDERDFIISSVNGWKTHKEYYDHIFFAFAEMFRSLLNTCNELKQADKVSLLHQALRASLVTGHWSLVAGFWFGSSRREKWLVGSEVDRIVH
jgi:hypothetical protein